jgi:hypothetical protein
MPQRPFEGRSQLGVAPLDRLTVEAAVVGLAGLAVDSTKNSSLRRLLSFCSIHPTRRLIIGYKPIIFFDIGLE